MNNYNVPKENNLKEWALYYAQLGLAVFPLQPRDKIPFLEGGFKIASKDPDQIEAWWTRWPDANIGVTTGAASGGLVVIDADVNEDAGYDGTDSLREYAAAHGRFPDTCRAITGRGGYHDYYRTGETLHNRAGVLEGVDVRADGGYVVAPPSIHPNGRRYTWEIDPEDAEIAEATEEILELCRSQAKTGSKPFKREKGNQIPEGHRNDTMFRLACSLQARGLSDEAILAACYAENELSCDPPMPASEVQTIVRHAIKYDKGSIAASQIVPTAEEVQVRPDDLTEAGAAETFSQKYNGILCWAPALGWMLWNGQRWLQDDAKSTRALKLATSFSRDILSDVKNKISRFIDATPEGELPPDIPADLKEYRSFARKMRSGRTIQSVLDLARPQFLAEAAQFDARPFDLNTPDGIVDLRTGTCRPHSPEAFCSKITKCSPSVDGREFWEQFLDDITGSNTEMKRYLQISIGSCAIGKVFHEGIMIAVGGGRNGKSTFFNAIADALGDYSGTIEIGVLTMDRMNRGAQKATLRGKRLVTCSELNEGQLLSTQTLKQLASTDALTIEEKFKAPETIRPSHHLVMATNYLPRIGSTDDGTWRRIQLVPFSTVIPDADDIPNYADVLVSEAGGAILSWVIEGAKMFCAAGHKIHVPDVVKEKTADYRRQENWLPVFIQECCIVDTDGDFQNRAIYVGELYQAYREYARSGGEYIRNMREFNDAMTKEGYQKEAAGGNKKRWSGIDLKKHRYYKFRAETADEGESPKISEALKLQ